MTTYVGSYFNDFGVETKAASIGISLFTSDPVSNTTVRTATTRLFDLSYVPRVFFDNVSSDFKPVCTIVNGTRTVRTVRIFIDPFSYLAVVLPFMGGSDSFKQFFDSLAANTAVLSAVLRGERVNSNYTSVFTRR